MVPYAHLSDDQPGPEFKVYNLPPALLTAPYFLEQCYEPVWDNNQIVVLQETIVEHFDVYEHWLLTSELRLTGKVREAKTGVTTREQTKAGDDVFLDAMVKYLIETLRLTITFQTQFIRLLTQDRVERVIAEPGVHSGFFKLIAHAYARFATVEEIRILAFSNYDVYSKSHFV